MIILGIDPGLATLGYGVIEADNNKRRMIQFGTLTTPAGQPMPQRLRAIFQGMNQLMDPRCGPGGRGAAHRQPV